LNQADSISGDGGRISVWQAQVPDCPRAFLDVQSAITGNLGWAQTLVVEDFNGAAAVANTVPPAFATGAVGSSPSVSITPQQTGSWIAAAGFDADSPTNVTPGSNQSVSATAQDNVFNTEMWFQYHGFASTASRPVTMNDTLSPSGAWDLAAVEIMPQT
jgi:hypothetical protein